MADYTVSMSPVQRGDPASSCVSCGECLAKCPQHLDIPNLQTRVKEMMGKKPLPRSTIFSIFAKQKKQNMNNFNPYIKQKDTDASKDCTSDTGSLPLSAMLNDSLK